MSTATQAYRGNAGTHLSSMQQASHSVVEQGAKQDLPTGSTPRKRVWEYVDEWELTQSRENLLRMRREQGLASTSSETFLAEHLPLPEAGDDLDDNEPIAIEEPIPPVESPISAASSTSQPPAPHPSLRPPMNRKITKSVLPSLAPLADARNVYTTRGSRRR